MNIKSQFPVFFHHPELVFLDSAASVQKPKVVLDATREFSEKSYANIHRGGYHLSFEASEAFESSRKNIAEFLGSSEKNLVFTKNGTEASNMIAHIFRENILEKDDEILISISEHHANILPWMRVAEQTGAKIVWVFPENFNDGITAHDFEKKMTDKSRLFVFAHVANVTGQIFPVTDITDLARKNNILTVVDACQSVPHFPVSFAEMNADAIFFTGHKLGAGATGGFILHEDIQKKMNTTPNISPFLLGGGIVKDVTEEGFSLHNFPENFEAGTPSIENIIGLSAAVDFLKIPEVKYEEHGKDIVKYALEQFEKFLPNWVIVGPKNPDIRSANVSFYHEKIHHLDVGAYLSEKNIAVRTGFHCANPLHHFLDIPGTVRASFWVYTENSDIDNLVSSLQEIEEIFV